MVDDVDAGGCTLTLEEWQEKAVRMSERFGVRQVAIGLPIRPLRT
jgi:hypothetical protein